MDIVSCFIEKVKGLDLSVVLPEGRDERIILAARRLKDDGIARPIVLGKPDRISEIAFGPPVDAPIKTISFFVID